MPYTATTRRAWIGLVATAAAVLAGCGQTTAQGASDQPVLVFAAASLTESFAELEAAFETDNPGVDVQVNLAGSAALREQILGGAPADVFASANASIMGDIDASGLVVEGPTTFATNRLIIAVPRGNPAMVGELSDFADDSLLIGLCAEAVPCGDLGRRVLASAGVVASIDTNESDVRALLTKIEADELDAGLVYRTDVVAAGDAVLGIDIPMEADVATDYPIAALGEGANPVLAADFVRFVLSNRGQAILADHGFGPG